MPRKKIKPREEKIAENYFPVDKNDLKYTTEKIIKEPRLEEDVSKKSINIPIKQTSMEDLREEMTKGSIEKQYSQPDKKSLETVEYGKKKREIKSKRKYAKKTSRTTKQEKYIPPKILLKKDGYELIITEKPQAALKISSALGSPIKRDINKIPYYELNRNGKSILVACAVGHLFTLKQNSPGSDVPIFDISWVPNYMARKGDFSKKYYDALLKLAKNAGEITVATDYDVEGELIGYNIVRYICNQKDAKRMKFSTLTTNELNKAYEEKSSSINWGQAIAGESRHYLDWFYGINFSRALMNSIKTTGSFRVMSIGRVQGPALNLIVKREKQIQAFKSEPYWQVFITVKQGKVKLELKYIKDIFNKEELEKFKDLVGKKAQAETQKTEQRIPPNPPFNLTTLQTEAYKFHGITPSNTLKSAQSLYLGGLISYPRTSSQKLPDSIDYKPILKKLAKEYKVEHLIKKEKPIEGKKTDPAHPSIYPTGNKQVLSGNDEKIYNLIVKRFLSLFCEEAIIDNKKIIAKVDGLAFSTKGSEIRKKSWMEIYPIKLVEKQIPDLNGEVKITDSKIEEKQTQPPKRYSPASIISELEKRNLGTKCLTGNTKIILNDSPVEIAKIFSKAKKDSKEKGTEIKKINLKTISLANHSQPKVAESKFVSRRKIKKGEKIVQIETNSSEIELTENHKVYILKDNKIQEISAKNISMNDKLIGITKNYKEGEEIITNKIFNKKYKIDDEEIKHKFASKNNRGIAKSKLPIKWSTSLAWLLGYYYGDGSYDGPKYNGSHSISFSTTEKKALKLLKEASKDIFGYSCYAYDLGSKYKVNLNSVMSYVLIKTFPELEDKNPIKIQREFTGDFLRGFFDADGNVHLRPKRQIKIKGIKCKSFDTPRIKITLANEKLIYWVHELLKEIKIETKINKGISTCNGKKFKCWTILISGRDKIDKYACEIGFDSYKEEILYKGLKCNSWKYTVLKNSALIYLLLYKKELKIEKILQETNISRYQIITALKRMYKLGIINKKRYTNRNKWIYSLNKLDNKYLSHCIKLTHNKIKKDIYEIPIKKLSTINYQGYVYDLSVMKDSPNFITAGQILVHNSTRSSILETLYDRGYVKEKSIEATPLGISLIETLEKYSPIIVDEKLTREFENEMEKITTSKSGFIEKEQKVVDKAKKTITEISKQFEKNKKEIGKELLQANIEQREQQKIENKLCLCPKCKKGNLAVTYSKKTRRYFIACDAYPDCKNTFSLPPNSLIKKTDKLCEECRFPMLMSLRSGKKPWFFCFNPECPTNKQRIEEYNRKKAEENSESI